MIESELDMALSRPRYARHAKSPSGEAEETVGAATRQEIEARRKAFIRKWRFKHRAVADSLEEAGDRLFTFARLPPSQWRSARTTNAIERLHEEFKRRIKTQTVLPSAETAAMLFWACWHRARSTCAKWMAGRRSLRRLAINQLTLPRDDNFCPGTAPSNQHKARRHLPRPRPGCLLIDREVCAVFHRHAATAATGKLFKWPKMMAFWRWFARS